MNKEEVKKTTVNNTVDVFKSDHENKNLNFEVPDCVNLSLKNKVVTIQLSNNRIESGKITHIGQYFIEMAMPNGKALVINKAAIVTVTVM